MKILKFKSKDGKHATILADTVRDSELLTLDAQELLHRLYHEEDLILYDAKSIHFECSCSQQKIELTVRSIGEDEANSIIDEQGAIRIDCDFCNTRYELDSIDVKTIIQ